LIALLSSLTEGANSKLGVNDDIFWIYQIGNNSQYDNAETFFAEHRTANNLAWILPTCIFITDLYFIGSLFIGKEAENPNGNTATLRFREAPLRCSMAYGIVLLSCLAEGISAAPSLANIDYQYFSGCRPDLNQTDCDSAEQYVGQRHGHLLLFALLSLIRAYVDFVVEGKNCIATWLSKGSQSTTDDDPSSSLLGALEAQPSYGN